MESREDPHKMLNSYCHIQFILSSLLGVSYCFELLLI